MSASTARADHSGLVWLMSDMVLVTIMTVLVKIGGATYPALQMVFIRSLIGLVSVLPLAWRHRAAILSTRHVGRHVFRVFCNTLALSTNFAALTALPLAMANAIGFMRPLVVMVLATLLLSERSTVWRWVGASLGFVGVLIMVAPGDVAFNPGILAALGSVVFGSLAVIQTRALARENTTVLMVFYTVGLTVFTAIPAVIVWEPVQFDDWGLLLAIGILAQVGQYCFLRAYQSTPANILAPFGYLSIVLATFAGYVALNEVPSWTTLVGVAIIIGALAATSSLDRRKLQRDNAHDREL